MSDDPEYKQAVDDAYRALGRYMYEFSRLVWWMKFGIEHRLIRANSRDAPWIGQLLLGEAAAQHIANAFFGVMGLSEHDDIERAVAKKLRTQVNEVIQTHNDIAHGDWFIGYPT